MFDKNFKIILSQLQDIPQKYSISVSTKFNINEADLQLLRSVHADLCSLIGSILHFS